MTAAALLAGDRIVLRAAEPADLGILHRLRNDVESQVLLMSRPRGSSKARVREWVERMSADEHSLFLVVATRRGDRVVGYLQLARIDPWHGHGELGICLEPASRGRGYGREALRLVGEYAGTVLGLHKIVLRVLADHAPAVALYRRSGYRVVGTLREHFRHAGRHHDVLVMEKLLRRAS